MARYRDRKAVLADIERLKRQLEEATDRRKSEIGDIAESVDALDVDDRFIREALKLASRAAAGDKEAQKLLGGGGFRPSAEPPSPPPAPSPGQAAEAGA